MHKDHLAFLRILRSPKIGVRTFYKMMHICGGHPKAVMDFMQEKGLLLAPQSLIDQELDTIHKHKAHILFYQDPLYPELLKHISDAPPFITVKGNLEILKQHNIAIVGGRNASMASLHFIKKLSEKLGSYHYNIVSGLARGIDGAAHQGALTTGTIAVLAGGIDQIYPPEHKTLYHDIAETGLIVSEMPMGLAPSTQLFPRRNRIISGLSQAVILCEAASKSGSLITADYAMEQGREVFVIPGHPADPRSAGGNKLIQQGAHLVQSAEDILKNLPTAGQIVKEMVLQACTAKADHVKPMMPSLTDEPTHDPGQETLRAEILSLVSTQPLSLEALLTMLPNTKPHELMIEITHMELDDLIVRHDHQAISKK
ncbi:MAG: DNA-processing protein DprA [Alphaproteobacteria bacterium]|nr:DNA-processing protein DprA [Alphaproteobacteria bacterium]